MELIFLSVAAMVWVLYEENVDNMEVFRHCYEIKDFFQSLTFS